MQFLFAGCLVYIMIWFRQWLHHTGSALSQAPRDSKSKPKGVLFVRKSTSKCVKVVCTWLPFLGIVWASLDTTPLCLHELREGGGVPSWSALPHDRISYARDGGTCGIRESKRKDNTSSMEDDSTSTGASISDGLKKSFAFVDGAANARASDRCIDEELSASESTYDHSSAACTIVKICDECNFGSY